MSSNNSAVDKSMKLDILTTLNDSYLQKSDLSTMAYFWSADLLCYQKK